MAHMLEIKENGQASMAWAGEKPWHGLGREVPHDLTPEQMLEAAGLDWTVRKVPLTGRFSENGKEVRIKTDKEALVRSDTHEVLTVVSEAWHPVQNAEAFGFFHDFVMEGHMDMNTAGSLDGGKTIWALAKVKESFELFGGKDRVDSYLLFSNPHSYGSSVNIRFTPTRVVCNNTLSLALSKKLKTGAIAVNHKQKFDAAKVKEMMGLAKVGLDTYREAAEFISTKRYTEENLKNYVTEIFGALGKKEVSRSAKRVLEVMNTQPGAELGEGTWWQAFNAITFASDHLFSKDQNVRLRSAWYGYTAERKVEALKKAVEYAEKA